MLQFAATGTISRSGFRFVSEISSNSVYLCFICRKYATGRSGLRCISFILVVGTLLHHFLVAAAAVTISRLGFRCISFIFSGGYSFSPLSSCCCGCYD